MSNNLIYDVLSVKFTWVGDRLAFNASRPSDEGKARDYFLTMMRYANVPSDQASELLDDFRDLIYKAEAIVNRANGE